MIIDEIAAYLEALSVGEVGTDIFVGFAADEETGIQNNIVMVDQTGSVDPDIDLPILKPIVKVLVRNDAYSGGLAKLYQIHHLFDRMVDGTTLVPGGTEIMVVHTLAEPQHQERDDEGRDYFTCTFVFHLRGSDGQGPGPTNAIDWGEIEGDIEDQADLVSALSGKANTSHTHVIADTTGLQAALDAKAPQAITYTKAEVDTDIDNLTSALSGKQDTSERGQPLGYPTLDANGLIPDSYINSLFLTDTFVVGSQAAMLALTAERGDVAVRTDLNKTFILRGYNPVILGDWQELITPTDSVGSVNGRIGAVTGLAENSDLVAHTGNTSNPHSVTKAQVGLGSVDNTADTAKPVSVAQAAAIAVVQSDVDTHKADTANPHAVTKTQVGLGNADNTSDATKNSATATLTNKTLTSPIINSPTGIVKGDVGLGNVDNTSDATKDAATATLTNKTLTSPVIANIVPGADFIVTQNSVSAIVSEQTGAIVDSLHIKSGNIGIRESNPLFNLSFGAGASRSIGVSPEVTGTIGRGLTITAGQTTAGTNDINGGTMTVRGGLGTGTGSSNFDIVTGQKLASGSTLQTHTSRVRVNNIGDVGIGTISPTGRVHISGAVSRANNGVSGAIHRVDAITITDESTAASGTVTHTAVNALGTPTMAASNTSVTYTNASTLYINAAPANGTNVTVTNPWALYIAAGASYFGGAVRMNDLLRLKSYTVSTLPAGTEGDIAYVTDATTPVYLGALTGGGSVRTPVFKNASAWVSF